MKPFENSEPSDAFLDLRATSASALAAEELAIEHFTAWLDLELAQLVARWEPLASPKARNAGQSHRPRFDLKPR